MATVTFKGKSVNTVGSLPAVGSTAPDARLTAATLEDKALGQYTGNLVLNIFLSIDTPVCATSVRSFIQKAAARPNTTVLNISADLPFALSRFCGAAGIANAVTLSTFRSSFADDFGVRITEGPLSDLCARAVVVLDPARRVLYTQQVPELTSEPDYDAALAVLG